MSSRLQGFGMALGLFNIALFFYFLDWPMAANGLIYRLWLTWRMYLVFFSVVLYVAGSVRRGGEPLVEEEPFIEEQPKKRGRKKKVEEPRETIEEENPFKDYAERQPWPLWKKIVLAAGIFIILGIVQLARIYGVLQI